jgi:Na+-transporting NADH:ubiquinone oxidoreductase subunit B
MKVLRKLLDDKAPLFEKGGSLERFYPAYEAIDTFLYTPGQVTNKASFVRDGADLKRLMFTVVVALGPCMLMALYNTGYQTHLAILAGAKPLDAWQTDLFTALGFGFDPHNILGNFVHGALYFFPVYAVTVLAGSFWEVLFAAVRRHEVTEGFLVTSALIPLTLPPTIPLWQVALGTSFGIVLGKEVFGGVGYNVLNPALTVRAFLFFAYPGQISGDQPWIAANFTGVDGFTGATWLARSATDGAQALASANWWDAFFGFVPGSMGETSTLCCILGAAVLLITQVASWRTMAGVVVGTALMAFTLNGIGSDTNPMFAIPFHWHVVLGGWAFGTVFMATDPVSSSFTATGKLFYGFCIGILVVLVRVVNPAYPEGMMLAILFMNMFAPLIDHFVVQANVKRRSLRYAA